jgi:hypothetical protein
MSFVVINSSRYQPGSPLATGLFSDIVTDLNFLNGVNSSAVNANGVPLILNSSFESPLVATSTTPDNWTIVAGNAGAAVLSTSDQNHGAQSLKFTRDTTVGHSGGTATSDTFFDISGGQTVSSNQTAGLSYLFNFMIKSSRTDVSNTVIINWYDANQGALSSTTVYSETSGTTNWVLRSAIITPPVTAMFGKIVISGGTTTTTPASTATIFFDGFSIQPRPMGSSQTFYTSANNLIVPSGVFFIRIKMWSAANRASSKFGAYLEVVQPTSPGNTVNVVIANPSTVTINGNIFSVSNASTVADGICSTSGPAIAAINGGSSVTNAKVLLEY